MTPSTFTRCPRCGSSVQCTCWGASGSTPATTDVGALADVIVELLNASGKFRLDFDDRYTISMRHANALVAACRSAAIELRNSAPQETRGDEPVAPADEFGYFDLGQSFLEEYDRAVKEDCLRGFVCADSPVEILWFLINALDEAKLAAPQQSPRLEREGTISECVKAVEALKIRHAGKDAGNGYRFNAAMDEAVNAILALLSLDTASAASSTERCECIGGSTYNDGTQRRCDLCGKPVPSVSSNHPREVSE